MYSSVWIVEPDRSRRVRVGEHATLDIELKGKVSTVIAEMKSFFEDEHGSMMCQCWLLYSNSQLAEHVPFFNPKEHAKKGFKKKNELVIGVHPHIFPVTIMRDKVRVRDNIDDAGDNCAGASYFYRYEVNVHTKKVLALRTGCV